MIVILRNVTTTYDTSNIIDVLILTDVVRASKSGRNIQAVVDTKNTPITALSFNLSQGGTFTALSADGAHIIAGVPPEMAFKVGRE
jgi:hypothetical protein